FQAHLVQQNAGYLRIILRRLDMRRKQLQLFRLTLFVENLDGLQPACLCRAVQLTQITQRPLSWSVRSSNRFNQRPVGVIFAILDSMVRTQKHSGRMVSRGCWLPQEGRSTLHRRFNRRHCRRRVCYPYSGRKNFEWLACDELGLVSSSYRIQCICSSESYVRWFASMF